jgi:hypothetical protein
LNETEDELEGGQEEEEDKPPPQDEEHLESIQ